MSREYEQMPVARDLYLQALEEDPAFAPTWARIGRAYRLIGKYIEDPEENRARAEEAFGRSLELDPDLSLTHKLYAHFEAESVRAPEAMVRLLGLARTRPHDAELFTGLVHACRYCGLFEASIAAHEEARRLDPHMPTSLAYTLYLRGDYERLTSALDSVIDLEPKALGLAAQGRPKEALAVIDELDKAELPRVFGLVSSAMRVFLEGDSRETAVVEDAARAHTDPEALYMIAILFAGIGLAEPALDVLEKAVRGGFFVSDAVRKDPLLTPIRTEPRFAAILELAETGRREALRRFESSGGNELLGL